MFRLSAIAERDHELKIETRACFRNHAQDRRRKVARRSKRRVNQRPLIEALPRKFDLGSSFAADPWSGVMEICLRRDPRQFKESRHLSDMRKARIALWNFANWAESVPSAI